MQKETKQSLKKIGVLAVIIATILGIWLFKNQDSENNAPADPVALEDVPGYIPLHVTENIDLDLLKGYGLPIVIDFGADSCAPCKAMAPVLENLNENLAGKAIILFVDVWKYNELAQNFPVEVIPTQILIDAEGNPYAPSENVSVQYIQYTYRDTGELAFTAHQGGITEEQLMEALIEMGVEADD